MPKAQQNAEFDFENALKELNQLIQTMENGGLPLDESLKNFERGISLIRQCQDTLKKAEQKVQIYLEKENKLDSFETTEK